MLKNKNKNKKLDLFLYLHFYPKFWGFPSRKHNWMLLTEGRGVEVHLEFRCAPQTVPGRKGLVTTAHAKPKAGGQESFKDSGEYRFAKKKKRVAHILDT